MARLSLTLLGGFQALLAYLALPPGRAHPRDKLAALLWGGIRGESARGSLRQALFALRKALSDTSVVQQDGDALALERGAVDVDAVTFERLVHEGTASALEQAVALYQGDLLSGFAVDEAPFEEWLLAERERLRELALEALARLLASQRNAGASEAAVHPALMRLYAERGRRGAALRQYQQCVSVLGRELGIEPEAETKALYQEILRERPQHRVAVSEGPTLRVERAASTGAEAKLIGRADELGRLRDALAGAAAGAGQVIVLLGEAGIGKSRLVAEAAADAARRGVTVLLGRSYESEQILPFGPWIDAMRAGRIAADADLLERLGPALRAELARLLPEAGGAATPVGGAPDVGRVFESVAHVIGHLGGRGPLLVILEDLHWADELSARLVAFTGRRLRGWPVLLLTTAREDELADAPVLCQALDDLARAGHLATLALRPLSRDDTLSLVRTLARSGDDAALGDLGEQAWSASEGNPFVAVETVRAHAEGALVAHGRGVALPERVREIVGRRLERLSERGQSLAAVAAVIGREFEWGLLERAAGIEEEETAAGVEELVRRGVLHGRGERFDFTH